MIRQAAFNGELGSSRDASIYGDGAIPYPGASRNKRVLPIPRSMDVIRVIVNATEISTALTAGTDFASDRTKRLEAALFLLISFF